MSLNTTAPSYTAGTVLTAAQLNALQDGIQASWTSYAPTWTASTTNPVIGNGTIVGTYLQIGKTVLFRVTITMGSTTTFGAGNYQVSLPPVAPVAARWRWSCDLLDVSGSAAVHGSALHSGGLAFLFTTPGTAGAFDRNVTPSVPYLFASGDIITFSGAYETT